MTAQTMASPAERLHVLVRSEHARAAEQRTPAAVNRLEDVEFMHATGETWERIAARLDMKLPSLARWLLRNGHSVLGLEADQAVGRVR